MRKQTGYTSLHSPRTQRQLLMSGHVLPFSFIWVISHLCSVQTPGKRLSLCFYTNAEKSPCVCETELPSPLQISATTNLLYLPLCAHKSICPTLFFLLTSFLSTTLLLPPPQQLWFPCPLSRTLHARLPKTSVCFCLSNLLSEGSKMCEGGL